MCCQSQGKQFSITQEEINPVKELMKLGSSSMVYFQSFRRLGFLMVFISTVFGIGKEPFLFDHN